MMRRLLRMAMGSGDNCELKHETKQSEDEDKKLNHEEYKENQFESIKVKVEDSEDEKEDSELSPYERLVMKNRKERIKFMQSIKIFEAKEGFIESVAQATPKRNPVKRSFKKAVPTSPVPLRKSLRLAKLDVDLSENAVYNRAVLQAQQEEQIKVIPPILHFKEALNEKELFASFKKEFMSQWTYSKPNCGGIKYTKDVFSKMKIGHDYVAKVVPARIVAMAIHPHPETVIVSAGSKYGHVGLWNVLSDAVPYVMQPHNESISNLRFNPSDANVLVSSSYDGTLRCCNMAKENFEKVYDVSAETSCSYFDFLSPITFLVGQKNGIVSVVDIRTQGKSCEKRHACHDFPVKTVSVHPTQESYFISADRKGTIRLWDLRKLQARPVADIKHHKRSVNSAFFSPVSGNSILSTSLDDSLAIFDSSVLSQNINLKATVRHNNFTGRWLTIFRASWLPNSDDYFVTGSMLQPRRIEVFSKEMNIIHNFIHENLNTITSVNVFHPSRKVLAGGNSSGKVYVFAD